MRIPKLDVKAALAAARREAVTAAWPAVLSAVLGPMIVALVPGLRGVAAEYLPPGPERLLMMAAVFALGAEILRCHILKFSLARRLRAAEGELAKAPSTEGP